MNSPTNHPPCPICNATSGFTFSKAGFDLFDCSDCDHRFCYPKADHESHVNEVYADDYFSGEGDGYDDYLGQKDLLIKQGETYAKRIGRHLPEKNGEEQIKTILDVGAAAGFLLKGFENQGWKGVGVEANASVAQFGREKVGVDVRNQTIEGFLASNPKHVSDAVAMIQVLPHLFDPQAAVESVSQILKPGGHFLIETWDRKSLTARMFGKRWHEYNPPSVLHWFSKSCLKRLLDEAGFDVIDRGRPTKWIRVGNGISLIRYSVRDSMVGRIVTMPLALVPKKLKVPYFLDDVFWVLARKR